MTPPFSAEQFFDVFVAYNEAVWPAQVLLVGLAVVATVLAFQRFSWQGKAIAGLLALLWIWMGVAYHWAFFAEINPAAQVFGGLFVLEGLLFGWAGLQSEALSFRPAPDVSGWAGSGLIVYALAVYPLLGVALGHTYPAQPTFGLPCPTTIFTFGVLLWARPKVPWVLLAIPVAWAVVGSTAVRYFGVIEDTMLPISAIVTTALVLWRNHIERISAGKGS